MGLAWNKEDAMEAHKLTFRSITEAVEELDRVGSSNSRVMAERAIHLNVLLKEVPGEEAWVLKTAYNDIGAEAAISHAAYRQQEGAVTDVVVMGTLYQHREVRRILTGNAGIRYLVEAIEAVIEQAPESRVD
jgi:hypothetical protein